jgi:hypothetical protein
VRVGTGIVERFFGDGGGVVIAIRRETGISAFVCDDAVARALVREYGVEREEAVDMSRIIGLPVSFEESAAGVLVSLHVRPTAR